MRAKEECFPACRAQHISPGQSETTFVVERRWDNLSPVGRNNDAVPSKFLFRPYRAEEFPSSFTQGGALRFHRAACPGLVCSCPVGAEELPLTRRLMSVDCFLPAA